MKITVYYEDKRHPFTLEVPDADCEIWIEADYQRRLSAAVDKSSVTRRTAQEIMDEECNKPTFNSNQAETRRHVQFSALKSGGYGDLVYETVNANSLSAFVNEQIAENNEALPEWLNGLVNVYEQVKVSVRKAARS